MYEKFRQHCEGDIKELNSTEYQQSSVEFSIKETEAAWNTDRAHCGAEDGRALVELHWR